VTDNIAFIESELLSELDDEAGQYQPHSAFVAVGGARAVAAVVEEFYTRLLSSPQVAPYFEPLIRAGRMSTLKRHQVLMLTMSLGGPDRYSGQELQAAHGHLGITDDAYRRVCLHLLTTLHDFNVPMDILVEVDLLLRDVHGLIVTGARSAEGASH
jgi:hemoglobin